MIHNPVSATLEADLRVAISRHGLVLWLDADGIYTSFVDAQRAQPHRGYRVEAFRGSHLGLMLALEDAANGADKPPLVIHLPGFNEDAVRSTPLFELYAAGTRYRKSLDTLVTEAAAGHVRPQEIEDFLAQPGLSLAAADAWLTARLQGESGSPTAVLQAMRPAAALDQLLDEGAILGVTDRADGVAAWWSQLAAWCGLPPRWREVALPPDARHARDLAFGFASWVLCVEYVDDLKRAPVSEHLHEAAALPRPLREACRQLAEHLRERHPAFYRRTADETEALLADEVDHARAEDLGRIDTFRFEEDKVLLAAIEALQQQRWGEAATWAGDRGADGKRAASFWLREDPSRQSAWQLIAAAAALGEAIVQAGPQLGVSVHDPEPLSAAVTAYTRRGAAVDLAHRLLEQRRTALLYPQIPEFGALRARLDAVRRAWRVWADAWAVDFNRLCVARGFLPAAALQQRHLFDDVVKPLTLDPGTTAYFVVDAMRYEMAEELRQHFASSPDTVATLSARLAELPTVTEVGMNVLAPVARKGRLQPVFSPDNLSIEGFTTGEFRVRSPESRQRAMHDRVGGATCPWLPLDEVVSRDAGSLKRAVAQARLVVVHSQEIDSAGEKGVGTSVFDHVLQRLRAAWRLLRDAGVRRFVLTSDHGFLLLDDSARQAQNHGRTIDPQRRHVFSAAAADHHGEARVAMADLAYDAPSVHLMTPESTAVFEIGRRNLSFVHGGNALQERVIPVLTLTHKRPSGGSTTHYAVEASAAEGVAGMHCLEGRLNATADGSLGLAGPKELELALRVPEADGVQVEIVQVRGKARVGGGHFVATVGEGFEVFFRLTGSIDARVAVEVYHPSAAADVVPGITGERFQVAYVAAVAKERPEAAPPSPAAHTSWIEALEEAGHRLFFTHLSVHGTVTESEASELVGGPRAVRQLTNRLDDLVRKAPFRVRIESVAGVKRFVREGGE